MCQFHIRKVALIWSMISFKSNVVHSAMCDTDVNYVIDMFAGKCKSLLLLSSCEHVKSLRKGNWEWWHIFLKHPKDAIPCIEFFVAKDNFLQGKAWVV